MPKSVTVRNMAESAYGLPRPGAFIDLILLFEGELTNERLRRRYDVSNVQASRLLSAYADAYPANLMRDKGAGRGRYLIGPGFKAQASDGTINAYLAASSDAPRVTVMHTAADLSLISPELLRQVQRAITLSQGLSIRYRSMTQPMGVQRTVWPHAIVFAGHRWHVRAYDDARQTFLDLNLGRIDRVAPVPKLAPAPVASDTAWHTRVPLRLVPHPALTLPQRQLIRDEYFQGAASRIVECTGALASYMVRDMEVAVDLDAEAPPAFQVALANAKEVTPWLFGGHERDAGE